MKKILIAVSIFILSLLLVGGVSVMAWYNKKVQVRFMTNYQGSLTLDSGRTVAVNTELFAKVEVDERHTLEPLENNPTREGYSFVGWSYKSDTVEMFDFDTPINSNLTLYAVWERSGDIIDDDYKDIYVPHEVKTSSEVNIIRVDQVLRNDVESNQVKLTKLSLNLLDENKDDLKKCIFYTINPDAELVSVTYSNNTITVVAKKGESEETVTIAVVDDSINYTVTSSTNYENKAKNYESIRRIEEGGIVLAGSSSIENWADSSSDLEPYTTVNVGIGGTTVEQWSECLAERLVYPFNPRAVVFYVGINNVINSKEDRTTTYNKLEVLLNKVHDRLPNAEIYYTLLNLIPGYMQYKNVIEGINSDLKEFAQGKDWLVLVDAGKGLLKESGTPNSAYFLTDGLHMSLCGYAIWGETVKNAIRDKEKELYK